MVKKGDLSNQNNANSISNEDEFEQSSSYLEMVDALARLNSNSIYIIDYKKRKFEHVSDNPLFLCGNTREQVLEMGFDFYYKFVPPEDRELLMLTHQIGVDFFGTIPIEDRKKLTFSYDFHLQCSEGRRILVNQKVTPIFLTADGSLWKSLCHVSLSEAQDAGNIRVFVKGNQKLFEYDEKLHIWRTARKTFLTDREIRILQLSLRGYGIDEIAKIIFISSNTVKFHRKKIYEKFEVTNIADAISHAKSNHLI